MADDGKKFDIEVGTKADTSGLEAAERALKAVEAAGKSAANPMADGSQLGATGNAEAVRETTAAVVEQRAAVEDLAEASGNLEQQQADVAEAEKRASDRRVEEGVAALKQAKEEDEAATRSQRLRLAAGAALGASAAQIAALTVDVIKQYRELGVEMRGFESIGLEFADFLTSPFEYVVDAFTDYKADLAALKESQRRVIEQERIYQQTVARRNRELEAASERRINVFLAGEEAAVNQQTAAYERQLRVVDSLAKAEEARAKAADAIALANGADPNAIAAGAAARQAASAGVAQDQRVITAEKEVEDAIRRFDALSSALAQASTAARPNQARIDRLSEEAQQAQDAIGDAQAELETIQIGAAAAKSEITSGAVAEFQGVATAATDANTKAAEEAKATLQNEAAEQGKTLSAGGKEALKILTDALKDGVVTPEEMTAVATAIQQVKNSRDAADAEIRTSFEQLEKSNNLALENQRVLTERLRQQAAQFERLQQELR